MANKNRNLPCLTVSRRQMLIQCSCNKCPAGASDMSNNVTRPLLERTDLIREVKADFLDVRGKTEKMNKS